MEYVLLDGDLEDYYSHASDGMLFIFIDDFYRLSFSNRLVIYGVNKQSRYEKGNFILSYLHNNRDKSKLNIVDTKPFTNDKYYDDILIDLYIQGITIDIENHTLTIDSADQWDDSMLTLVKDFGFKIVALNKKFKGATSIPKQFYRIL